MENENEVMTEESTEVDTEKDVVLKADTKNDALAITSLVFAFLGGIFGVVLALIGLNYYEKGSKNWTICRIAMLIAVIEVSFIVVLFVGYALGVLLFSKLYIHTY